MVFSHSGNESQFGQGGQASYYRDPPVNLSHQDEYDRQQELIREWQESQIEDGEHVKWPKLPAEAPERPLATGDDGSGGALTNRAPHDSSCHTTHGDNGHRYKVICGIDWLKLDVYITQFADGDPSSKICPLGTLGTVNSLIEWREANDVKTQVSHAAIFGGTGYVAKGYPFYGNHVQGVLDFRCDGIRICIADPRLHTDNSKPFARIEVGGKRLTRTGHLDVMMQIETLMRGLGVTVDHYKVERLDIRADVLNVPTGEFLEWVHRGNSKVSNFKKSEERLYGPAGEYQSLYFGNSKGGRVMLRMYDKIAQLQDELRRGRDIEAQAAWQNLLARYDEVPTSLLRVEYQVGKEWIREHYGSCELQGLLRKLDHIVDYLFTQQFRVLNRSKDGSGNHSLKRGAYQLHDVWASIVESTRESDFSDDVLSCDLAQRVERRKAEKSREHLQRRVASDLITALAVNYEPEEIVEICSSDEKLLQFGAELTAVAIFGKRETICDKAIAKGRKFKADDVLPDKSTRRLWDANEIVGIDVCVHDRRLYAHTQPLREAADEAPF